MKKIIILLLIITSCGKSNSKEREVNKPKNNSELTFNLIAHRGGVVTISTNPENSLGALKEAINKEYKMVEIDIRSTLDGVPIIHHDSVLAHLNKGEVKLVSALKLNEIQNIKITNKELMPYTLEEFVKTSNGNIGFLLDFKGNYPDEFYEKCIDILKVNNISNVKIAWSKKAKEIFSKKNYGKIGLNYSSFEKASLTSTFLKEDYFLLISAFDYNVDLINKAISLDLEIVVSVNLWKYGQRGITNTNIIKIDVDKMIMSGVKSFLIDSDLEFLFNKN